MTSNWVSRRTIFVWGGMLVLAAGLSLAFGLGRAAAGPTCTKTWVGTGSGQWTTATDWTPNGVPGPTDFTCIPSTVTGTVTLSTGTNDVAGVSALGSGGLAITGGSLELNDSSDASVINALAFSAGTLQVDSGVATSLTGTSTWSAGTLQGSGTTTLSSGSTLNLAGGTPELIGGQTFVNAGTTNQTSGNFCLGQAATFRNTGTFTATANNNEVFWCVDTSSYPPTFSNASGGKFTSTVAATFSLNLPFNNAGTVDVTQGTLETGGGNSLGATDTGAYSVSGGTTLNLNDQRTLAASATVTGGTLALTGTTNLTLNGQSFSTVTQSGGTTNGPFTITGSDNWSGGIMTGSGTTSIASAATLDLTGGTPELIDHTLTNSGTVDWTSGNVCLTEGAVLTNDKTFTVNPGGSNEIYNCVGGQPSSLTNASGATMTVQTATADTVSINVPFDNAGALTVTQGSLETNGGNAPGVSDTGSYTLDAGTALDLNDQRSFAASATISTIGNGVLDITSAANVTFDGQSVANITQSSGVASGTFTVTGSYGWSGGNLSGAGTTTLSASGTLTLNGGTPELLYTHSFVNDGSASWTSGNLCLGEGATFENQGSFAADASGQQVYNCGQGDSPAPLFSNLAKVGNTVPAGSITVTVGATSIAYMAVPFNNNGTVAVNDGYFETSGGNSTGVVDAGTYTLASGTIFYVNDQRDFKGASTQISGTGELALDGNVTFNKQKLTDLEMSGGLATGSFTLEKTFTWSGGTINGTGSITLASTSTTSVTNSVAIEGPKVTSDGTIDWSLGYFEICDGTVFTNDGTFTATATGYQLYNCGSGSATAPEFINKKTMNVSAASGIYDTVPFNNTKTVNVTTGFFQLEGGNTPGGVDTGTYALSAGATLFADDYRTLTSAAKITGSGLLSVDSSAVLNLDGQSLDNMAQTGGSIVGPFTLTGSDAWSGGSLAGTGTVTLASTSTTSITGSVYVEGPALTNEGTVNWSTGYLEMCYGTVFTNDKTINATASGYQIYNCDSNDTSAPRMLNASGGTIDVNNTTGTGLIYVESLVTFDNAGTVDVEVGTFEIDGPNTPGQSDTGTYDLTASATLLIDGQRTLASGATVSGTGTLLVTSGAYLTLSGQSIADYSQTGGDVYGPFTVTGTYDWSGGYLADTGAGTTTTVAATATLDITNSVGVLDDHTLLNDGIINWTSGYLCLAGGAELDNTATFNAETINYEIYVCTGSNQTAPELLNASGATLTVTSTTGNTYILVPTVNDGTIDIASGILDFNNQDLNEPSGGTLQMVIDGTTAGTGFGQLQVSGTATLSGTLDVVTEAGFTPAANSTYKLITAGTLVGTFSTVNTTSGFSPGYAISYNPTASPPNVTATAN